MSELVEESGSMASNKDTQLGDYRLLDRIGAGGMGEVYLAEHVHLRKKYALKILPTELARDPGFVNRFHDEARMMADLHHPHIVQVHYMGHQDEKYYLVMDYITGLDGKPLNLQDSLSQQPQGRFPQARVRALALEIASALEYAHERNVVHRDIKPSNILLDAGGRAYLSDFGLAKAFGAEAILSYVQNSIQQSLSGQCTVGPEAAGSANTLDANAANSGDTGHSAVGSAFEDTVGGKETIASGKHGSGRRSGVDASGIFGTYDYMSPEQRGEGGVIDHRSDIYAFGVILYRLLTGRRPVGIATPPSRLMPALDPRWDAITARCMAYAQEDRYPSARELIVDIQQVPDDSEAITEAEEARHNLAVGRYIEARQSLEHLQKLGKAGESLAAQIGQEFADHARTLCEQIEQALAAGKSDEARRVWTAASLLAPDMPDIARLRKMLEGSEELNSLVSSLQQAFTAEDFPMVWEIIARLRSLVDAGANGAPQVLADAESGIAQCVLGLTRQAERELADANLQAATHTIEKARAADPTGQLIGPIADRVMRLVQAETLLRDFQSLLDGKQYARAREVVEQLETLGEEGAAGAASGRERLKTVCRELTILAADAAKQKLTAEAVTLATAALEALPGDPTAQKILMKAQNLARSLELYEGIKQRIKNSDYKGIQALVGELKRIETYGPALMSNVEKQLQGISKKLSDEAQEAVLAGQWERGRDLLEQAVEVNPDDANAREMLQEVNAELASMDRSRKRRAFVVKLSMYAAVFVFACLGLRWMCNGCVSWVNSIGSSTQKYAQESRQDVVRGAKPGKKDANPALPSKPATWGEGLEMIPLSKLGHTMAIQASLNAPLDKEIIAKALQDRFGSLAVMQDTLCLPQAGPRSSTAWIRTGDGLIVLACKGDAAQERCWAGMTNDWFEIAQCIRSVTASLAKVDLLLQFYASMQVNTLLNGQYQWLYVKLRNGEGVLKWPSGKPEWASFAVLKMTNGEDAHPDINLQGKELLKARNHQIRCADLKTLPFGDHRLEAGHASFYGDITTAAVIHGYFPKPEGKIELSNCQKYDVQSGQSRKINDLVIPRLNDSALLPAPGPGAGETTAAAVGLRSALAVDLESPLNLAAISRAVEAKGWKAANTGRALIIRWQSGDRQRVWLLASGQLIVGDVNTLADVAQVDLLQKTWRDMAETIASVTAAISQEKLAELLLLKARFYTEKPRQYQRIAANGLAKSIYPWLIDWPDSGPLWGRLTGYDLWGNGYTNWRIDERDLPKMKIRNQEIIEQSFDLGKTTGGQHELVIRTTNQVAWLTIEAFLQDSQGQIALYDTLWQPKAIAIKLSRSLSELILPDAGTP